ncbi:MAG: hypothetical protein ACLRXK_04385 [Acutalibacteraceae bacterium]
MLLNVTIVDAHSILNNLKTAYTWLFGVMSDLWTTISNNPLLMTATMIFIVLTACSVLGLLIVSIAPAVYGKSYSNSYLSKYPNPNNVYSRFSKNGLIYTVYDVLLKRKKQKEKEDEAAQAAYEKVVEEQEALQHKHELYNRYKPMADIYFKNYPFRYNVQIDGITYFNPDSKSFKQFKNSSNSQSYDIDEAIEMANQGVPKYKKK